MFCLYKYSNDAWIRYTLLNMQPVCVTYAFRSRDAVRGNTVTTASLQNTSSLSRRRVGTTELLRRPRYDFRHVTATNQPAMTYGAWRAPRYEILYLFTCFSCRWNALTAKLCPNCTSRGLSVSFRQFATNA